MVRRQQKRSKKGNSSSSSSSGVVLCLMRLAFFVLIILLIVLVLVTTVYYTLDLTIQSTCRTVHDDQSYLINLISGNLEINFHVKCCFVFELNREINRSECDIW